ncbi:MAG: hypothetical protein AB1454_05065 [Candidatus Auribacterota bacterium]
MSLLIKALNKLERHTRNGKRNQIKTLLGLGKPSSRHKRHLAGFWIGLFTGTICMVMLVFGLLFFLRSNYNARTSPGTVSTEALQSPAGEVPVDDIPSVTDVGPDIDDELLLDEIRAEVVAEANTAALEIERTLKNLARQETGHVSETPEKAVAIAGLPELYISGVIWDFSRKYAVINGMPLRENEHINDVLIKKISYSYLIVEYNSKEYEIVLE